MYSSVGPLSPGPPLLCDVVPVYINTNEIPGELSHENLTSSHVKITCYLQLLWLHNKLHFSHQNTNKVKWLVFHWCLYNNCAHS